MMFNCLQSKRHGRVSCYFGSYKKNAPDVEVGMTVLQFDIGITKGDHVLTNKPVNIFDNYF